ncbi:MAG: ribonuclease HII [Halobaculum sp.]|jgi:ribonuclease HII
MVAGAVRAVSSALPAGIDDSKRLDADERERLAATMRDDDRIETATAAVGTDEIDDPETDMNELTVLAQARALATVARDGDRAVVDAGDVSESRFGRRVTAAVAAEGGAEVDVTATHGADERDAVVAAASVLAKVERDRRIAAVDAEHDRDVGSGYPSDPTTRAFLADYVDEHGSLPPAARASWQTAADVLAAAEQSGLDEF